ncbi:hypothetical protein Q3G72_016020 [Acer saccharum]|nr:hypothetical protein Q3G72_016020 [Acer saccharum]
MSSGRSPQLLLIILVSLSLFSIQNVFGFNSGVEEDGNIIKCIESERHALLMFKQGLIDDYGYLSSWGDDEDKKECCKWKGISCSNRTGHVIKLNLQFSFDFPPKYLRGTSSSSIPFVNSSKSLALLDLSQNDLSNSTYLHLSNFSSSIVHLDLSSSHLEGPIPQYVFSNMTFLRYLDLSGNNLQGPIPQYVFSNMTFLRHLDLSGDHLQGPIPKYVFSNMTFLRYLDLSSNNLQGLIPQYVFSNMTFLRHLDLSDNNLQGPISQYAFSNMTFLHHLDLSSNNIQGSIPKYAFSNTASLRHIDLYKNQIDGIDAEAFTYICSLKTLDLESNNLTVQLSNLFFNLSDCTKRALESLTLDDNMLCGSLPDFTEFISLKELDISYNQLNAITPAKQESIHGGILDMEGSKFIKKYRACVQDKTEWALCFCLFGVSRCLFFLGFQMPLFSGCFLYV